MKRLVSVVVLSMLAGSCGGEENAEAFVTVEDNVVEDPPAAPAVPVLPVLCPTRDEMAGDPFAKRRSLSCSAQRSHFLLDRLEPSLEMGVPEDVTAFRLYIRRSWAPDSLVRLQKIGDKIELIEKGLFSYEGERRDTWLEPRVSTVSSREWNEWLKRFRNSGFFERREWDPKDMASQADGCTWKLEAAQNGRYHGVARTDQPANQEFLDLCQALLEIGKR